MSQQLQTASKWGLYGYALFLPFSISGTQGAMAFCLAVWIAHAIVTGSIGYRFRVIDPFLLVFLAWTAVAAIFAVHPEITLPRLRRYWIFLGYFGVAHACRDKDSAISAIKILVLSSGVVAIYSIAQHFYGDAVPRYLVPKVKLWQETGEYFHSVGLFDHHLTYGNSLILILCAGLGLVAMLGPRLKTVPYAIALALTTVALVFSYARSAWVGFMAGTLVFAYQLGKKVLIAAAVLLGIVGTIAVAASPTVQERFETALSARSNLERIAIWSTTVEMIRDHPVFGIGRGNYRRLAPEYRIGYNIHWTAKSHAHNSYLQVAVESGLIAFVAFAGWLAALFVWASRKRNLWAGRSDGRLMAGLIAAHTAFAVSSVFQHNLGDAEVAMTWFFLIAATFAVADNDKENQDRIRGAD
jgi:O-antigen ligase